jgi:uncharacterized lipoprotein NlpE involved in copper resistance
VRRRRSAVTVFVVVLILSGCANLQRTTKSLGASFFGTRGDMVDAKKVAQAEGRLIQVTLGKQKAVLVAQNQMGDMVFWAGLGNVSMVTNAGRVISLIGVDHELRHVSNTDNDPLATGQLGQAYQRHYDLMPEYYYHVPVSSTFEQDGQETLTVLGYRKTLQKIKEKMTFVIGSDKKTLTNYF